MESSLCFEAISMNHEPRDVNNYLSKYVNSQWYDTGYWTQGRRISPDRALVPNTSTSGISQNPTSPPLIHVMG